MPQRNRSDGARMPLMVAVAVAVAATVVGFANAEVAMVFSVQRHGARNVLSKTAYLRETDAFGGPSLLPVGQRMCYQAGQAYNARYLNATTCATEPVTTCLLRWDYTGSDNGNLYGVLNSTGVGFNNYNLLFTSSALDRSMQSAQSFLSGIFPAVSRNSTTEYLPTGQEVVPVYTMRDMNDYIIRAYTKCPAYDAMLNAWYNSTEFKAKEAESADFRDSIAKLFPTFDTHLVNWWNVYDPFNAWDKYQIGGENLTLPTRAHFDNMTSLAYWLEVSKMRSNLTGSLLGGALVGKLSDSLQAAAKALMTPAGDGTSLAMYQILGFSSHYNTQLGLLGALKLDAYWPAVRALTAKNASWLATGTLPMPGITQKLPGLASVVAFELHAPASARRPDSLVSAEDLAVRLAIQDGPSQPYVVVPLPCQTNRSDALGGPEACVLPDFLSYIQTLRVQDNDAWCGLCQNTNMTACMLAIAQARSGGPTGHEAWEIAVAVVLSVFGTAALVAGAFALYMHKRRPRQYSHEGPDLAATLPVGPMSTKPLAG